MFSFRSGLKSNTRLQQLKEGEQLLVADFLDSKLPNRRNLLDDSQLIAVDFETTGLDAKKDEIISMGFCPINDHVIRLAECLHIVIKTQQNLTSGNVAIHGLTDDILTLGITQQQALFKFMELVKGKIIVAHYHNIERTFIQKLAKQTLGISLPLSFLDTFWFAEKRMKQKHQTITSNSLRLFNLRKQQGLPNYKAHNALEDAISTAELLLAQKSSLSTAAKNIRLKEMGLFNYKA